MYEGMSYTEQEERRYYDDVPPPWKCVNCGRFFGNNKPHDCPKYRGRSMAETECPSAGCNQVGIDSLTKKVTT